MNLTHDDHLRWRLIDELPDGGNETRFFGLRRNDNERFVFRVGQIQPNPGMWVEELHNALIKLMSHHGKNLALFYSGGADSEVVLRMLVQHCGVKPEVHIIRFADQLNAHEVKNAFTVCEAFGIEPVVWEHDVMRYIRDEKYMDLALKYQCSQLAYLTVLEYARRVDKPVIMGGEIYLQKHQQHAGGAVHAPTGWYYIYREDEDGVTYRYSYDTRHPIINEFFTYTPELLWAWLAHPMVRRITTTNVEPGKITFLSLKRGIYEHELGFPLSAKTKFHGYEALGWANVFVQRKLKELLPKMRVCRYEYNQLVNDLCTPLP